MVVGSLSGTAESASFEVQDRLLSPCRMSPGLSYQCYLQAAAGDLAPASELRLNFCLRLLVNLV